MLVYGYTDMETILNYNFNNKDIADKNFEALYRKRRRDSVFAYVFKEGNHYWALRDHIGIVPLFYRKTESGFIFSTNIRDLVIKNKKLSIDRQGLNTYLGFGTTKIISPFKEVIAVPPGTVIKISEDGTVTTEYFYQIQPRTIRALRSLESIVKELDEIFYTAISRQIKSDPVGLCLSGGIDSGLIGIYLKKAGIKIHAFTSATRGEDEELQFFRKNCELVNPDNIEIDYLSSPYEDLTEWLLETYKQPSGNITALAMTSMWRNTSISYQKQIFFGQNSDVINNAMDNSVALKFGLIPKKMRRLLQIKSSDGFDAYVFKMSGGMVTEDPIDLGQRYPSDEYTNFQLGAIAGMYLGRTPTDGELLAQPAINSEIIVSNPYYDIDLIEFILGVPVIYKLRFKNSGLSLDKKIMQKLALKNGVPLEMVYRKKGFTISKGNTADRANFFSNLPESLRGINLINTEHRFAALTLNRFIQKELLLENEKSMVGV